jgi:hypothetical protein
MKKSLVFGLMCIACATIQAEQRDIVYSDFQSGFMKVVAASAQKYAKAENELQKSALVSDRIDEFRKIKGDPRKIKDWYGVLEQMGTNGDGKAYVTIRLSPKILTFSSWNNAFSDMNDKSLIPQQSPVYKKLSVMKIGNIVKFSGRLKRPKNLTEEAKMMTPDFLFIFSDIEKIGDSLAK